MRTDLPYTEGIRSKILGEIEKLLPSNLQANNEFLAGGKVMKEEIIKAVKSMEL